MGIRIKKEAFLIYEEIRKSGKTNMYDICKVIELSGNRLDEGSITYIMKHYEELAEAYL